MDHLQGWWSWRSFTITSCSSSSTTCPAPDKASALPRSEKGRINTLTWQYQDVHEGLAVIEPRCHHTVCPQPLGSQLIHFPAGGDGVAAGHHPVVGGRGHNHPDPAHETADKSSQVQAGGHHLRALARRAGQDSARGSAGRGPGCCSGRDGLWQDEVPDQAVLQTLGCLCPAPSLGGVSPASGPPAHGRSKWGSPNFCQSVRGERREWRGGDAPSHPTALGKQARGVYSIANSTTSRNLVQREKKLKQCLRAEV